MSVAENRRQHKSSRSFLGSNKANWTGRRGVLTLKSEGQKYEHMKMYLVSLDIELLLIEGFLANSVMSKERQLKQEQKP